MFGRRRRLDHAERRAFASALLQMDSAGHGPTVLGAERLHERGGRVLASLGGMFMELVMTGFRPDLDLSVVGIDDFVRTAAIPGLRPFYPADQLPDDVIQRLAPPMVTRWRDGDFRGLEFDADDVALIRVAFAWKDLFENQPLDGSTGRERWPYARLLEFWDLETMAYADRHGRW